MHVPHRGFNIRVAEDFLDLGWRDAGSPATLGGTGKTGLAGGKSVSVTGATLGSTPMLAILNPGADSSTPATLTIGTPSVNTALTFGNLSELLMDLDGGAVDSLTVHGKLTLPASGDTLLIHTVHSPSAGAYANSVLQRQLQWARHRLCHRQRCPHRLRVANNLVTGGSISLVQQAILLPSATPAFGTVLQGSMATVRATLYNLAALPGSTAQLELAGGNLTPRGDWATFTGLTTFGSLTAGGPGQTFIITMDTSGLGTFSGLYTLVVGDQTDLSGNLLNVTPLTVMFTGQVVPVPEPASLVLLAVGGVLMLPNKKGGRWSVARRSRRRG